MALLISGMIANGKMPMKLWKILRKRLEKIRRITK